MNFSNPLALVEDNVEKTRILLSMALENISISGRFDDLLFDSVTDNTRFLVKTTPDNKFQKFPLNGYNYIVIPKDLVDSYEGMSFNQSTNDFADKIVTMLGMKDGFLVADEAKDAYETTTDSVHRAMYLNSIQNIQSTTGERFYSTNDFEYDGIDIDIKNDFIAPKFYSGEVKKADPGETSGGGGGTCEMSMNDDGSLDEASGTSDVEPVVEFNTEKKNLEQSMEIVDQEVSKKIGDSRFYSENSIDHYKYDFALLDMLTQRVSKALKGHTGKTKKYTPTKRMSSRAFAMDIDKMYVGKSLVDGKHIKMNFIVDMSGSMSGEPMKNSASILYIMNRLAQEGLIEGNILYSTTRENMCVKMPLQDKEVLSLTSTGSAEGIAGTINKHQSKLRNANCICLTDGDIVDSPIEKVFWTKNNITSTGMYATPSYKFGEGGYDDSLNQWFNHTILAKDVEGLVERIIQVGLK